MNIVITGASSGLGKAIKEQILKREDQWFFSPNATITIQDWSLATDVDLRDWPSIALAAAKIETKVDVLINCAGVNEISYIEDLRTFVWDDVMETNARGLFLTVKALVSLGKLQGGTICNIISNASHMPMTASLAYNASKGAAHIMTLQMARELWARHRITVFGISPNKLAGTGMSAYIEGRVPEVRGWTPEHAKAYQLNALPIGEETDPETLAEFITFLLSSKQRHKFLHGTVIPYGA